MKNLMSFGLVGCVVAAFALQAVGCATPGKGTGIGAAAGGGTGAVVGGLAGGWKGAAIGAGAGAVLGGAIGNQLDRQSQELKKVADTKRTENGILVNLKNDLLFDTGSSDLKQDAQEQLAKMGDILAKYPDDRIRISGFTDSTGGDALNKLLSQQRAQSVSTALSLRGVKTQQMSVEGLGPERPVASNKTTAGRSKNRRVELHIDIPAEPAQG